MSMASGSSSGRSIVRVSASYQNMVSEIEVAKVCPEDRAKGYGLQDSPTMDHCKPLRRIHIFALRLRGDTTKSCFRRRRSSH